MLLIWQVRRESNPQPSVLETAALPIAPRTYRLFGGERGIRTHDHHRMKVPLYQLSYFSVKLIITHFFLVRKTGFEPVTPTVSR